MARCAQIPEFVEPDCVSESGRVVALAFIHKDIHAAIYNDPSNASLWEDGAYAADLTVFQEVRGTYDGGAPTEVAGVGNQDVRTVSKSHTMNVRIPGVKGNEDFFNEIVKDNDYRVAFVVGGDYNLLMINNVDTSITGGAPVEEGLDTNLEWSVDIKWKDLANPKTSNVPANIFN